VEFLLLLSTPFFGALALSVFGARRWAPELNVAVSLVTFLCACALTARVVSQGPLVVAHEQFFIDPFNVFLVTLTAFVGLTTSLFSRPYMRVEMDHGRLSALRLRLYHSMYQLFMATMLIALTTNNMGLVWVAMEAATLSTVLLVTLYRTPASLEAGWTDPKLVVALGDCGCRLGMAVPSNALDSFLHYFCSRGQIVTNPQCNRRDSSPPAAASCEARKPE
jgi:hydrogenase-4 component F